MPEGHREIEDSHTVTYWAAGGRAGTPDNATRAEVDVAAVDGGGSVTIGFVLPEERASIEEIRSALRVAFQRGKESAKSELRNWLGRS